MIQTSAYVRRTDHPYQVASLADLPAGLRQTAERALAANDSPETILIVPPQVISRKFGDKKGGRSVADQALIFTARGLWHLRQPAPPNEPGFAVYLPGSTLLYAHLSLILLYGRLELCGLGDDGPARIVIEYNTVSHRLVKPALERLLSLSWGPAYPGNTRDEFSERFLFGAWNASLKYRNGLDEYVLKFDKNLVGCIFQPPVTGRFLGIIPQRLMAPVLLTLTDHQLVVLEEGKTSATSYAYYITYCPRACIAGIDYHSKDAWQEMLIRLRRGEAFAERQTTLEGAAAHDWQTLWARQGNDRD